VWRHWVRPAAPRPIRASSRRASEGDRRSKVEIVADEVGPSLRWARADVTKNERSGASDGGAPGPRNVPHSYDEEPF
jgi:single-strand DNA-binding protein